ncbi:MAG: hypothetical protein K940chlam3_01539, partial [Chlamydiae bacterium]|nr:hypothetical protein [Chlamydiota bacterium]
MSNTVDPISNEVQMLTPAQALEETKKMVVDHSGALPVGPETNSPKVNKTTIGIAQHETQFIAKTP